MATIRATTWSVTINNPTAKDEEEIEVARQKGWRVEGQKEQGEGGTLHYQLCVRTPQVRFSAVKKAFSRAHIEVARNPTALSTYVHKEETRVSELGAPSDKYPSLNKYWDMIYAKFDVCEKWGWDQTTSDVRFYDARMQAELELDPLTWLDRETAEFIEQGYFVEHHVVNPAVRSQWRKFFSAILKRARMRQTDRQTDSVQTAQIPVLDQDITNADANTWEESGLSQAGGTRTSEDDEGDSEGSCSTPFSTGPSSSDGSSQASDS